ncbi:MAG: DUF4870 domain-containing protein [Acidimicrobiales bacterium]
MTNEGTGAPAGWYPTDDGRQRYWDGTAWTEHFAPGANAAPAGYAPMGAYGAAAAPSGSAVGAFPSSDERSMAMIAHLLGIVASLIGPLIIYLVKKDESPFVRDQAAEALNFSISMAIYFTAYAIVSFILVFVIVGIFLFILMPFLALGVLALHVVGAVKANKGEYYRYPLTIRFIK